MHPIIFKLGPISIYSYGVMLSLGFLIAVLLTILRSKKIGLSLDEILDLAIYLLISGIVGARLLHIFVNFSYYQKNPLEIIMLQHGGLAYQGGAFLASLTAVWYLRKKKKSFLKTADYIIPYAALAQSIGRLGCFLNGCCYGRQTTCFLGVLFPDRDFPIHPTQIYYSFSLLVIFMVLKFLGNKKKFDGQIFLLYFILHSAMRFLIDFLRGDLTAILFGLTLTQIISIFVIIFSVIFYGYLRAYERSKV